MACFNIAHEKRNRDDLMSSSTIQHIVIAGGGSAGWLSAALIAAEHQAQNGSAGLQVTLIESPDVAPIGVGEGTWPSMRITLRRIGVSEADFIRECDASFKQGSRFNGWTTGAENDFYFHPFTPPQGEGDVDMVAAWQRLYPERPFAEVVCPQPELCLQGKAPKQIQTPEYAAVANYGYHLDATKLGLFLRRHCLERLGVRHVSDHILAVNSHENGDIASLQTRDNGAISGDLFIDCTGMQSLLLGKHFGVALIPQKHILFNDTAMAVQVPYPNENSPIASQTLSTAQDHGWIWDIGLPTRRGTGYVYSSAHGSDEQAETALRAYVAKNGGPTEIPQPRKLSFTPGHREKFWHRNCVAIGQSAGFIEPLEASALVMVELSAALVSEQMPATRDAMDILAKRFNDLFTYRWSSVINFLKLHYVLTKRTDTAYWRDNCLAETIPEQLTELLQLWQHHNPSRHDFSRVAELFPAESYQYILYGMGFRTNAAVRTPDTSQRAAGYIRDAALTRDKMLAGLQSNRDLIRQIVQSREMRK